MSTRIGHLLTREALEEMDTLWPDRCPDPTDPLMRDKCAMRSVINSLWIKWKQVNEPPPQDNS